MESCFIFEFNFQSFRASLVFMSNFVLFVHLLATGRVSRYLVVKLHVILLNDHYVRFVSNDLLLL